MSEKVKLYKILSTAVLVLPKKCIDPKLSPGTNTRAIVRELEALFCWLFFFVEWLVPLR